MVENLDQYRTQDQTAGAIYEGDHQDDEDFYDNDHERQDSVEEIKPVRIKLMGNKELILPDISVKSGSSQMNALGANRRSMKDLHSHNVIYDHDLDDNLSTSSHAYIKNRRK